MDVEFTTVTAATRGELLDSGDIDAVLATFTITEERKKTWDFSTPYYTDYVSVLVEDSTGIKGLADLKDKVVGVSSGSTSARALVKAMIDEGVLDGANFDADTFNADTWKDGISFRQYDDYPAISTALSAGEVQGFCVDKSILAIYKTEGRSYIDAEFSPQEYGVATKKGSDSPPVRRPRQGLAGRWHHRAAHQRQRSGLSPDFSEPRECRGKGSLPCLACFSFRVLVHRLDAS